MPFPFTRPTTTATRPPEAIGQPTPAAATTVCARCQREIEPWYTTRTLLGASLCTPCRDVAYWQCSVCAGWTRDGLRCTAGCTPTTANPDDGYVDDGYDDDEDGDDDDDGGAWSGGLVRAYSYKPSPIFHGSGPLFLGLELEVATEYGRCRESAQIASTWLGGLGYLKADDSIGGGFEIVTHPMSYPWALEFFPWRMLPALHAAGCEATTSTGLHVHLSRAGFTGCCHTYRWMKFIHRNQPHVVALARRDDQQWACFDEDDRRAVKDYAKGRPGHYRYRAINTLNRDTFELRVFASTLQPRQVQAALGFAAASVEYTRTLTVGQIVRDDGWAWPAFTAWLAARPEYGALHDEVHALTATGMDSLTATGVAACAC